MSDLKPCPFCGREPEVAHRGGAFGFKCVCAGTRFVQAYGKTEEAAKLNWNMRFFQVPQSVADALAAKDTEIKRLQDLVSSSEQQRYQTCGILNNQILKLGRELQWIALHAKDRTLPASHRVDDIAEAASDALKENADV